jgi:MFS family permease
MNILADVLDLPPLFLVFANVLNGVTGGYAVFLAMVFAYAADVSQASEEGEQQQEQNEAQERGHDGGGGGMGVPADDGVVVVSSSATASGRASAFSWVESMLYVGNILGPLGMGKIVASGREGRDGGVLFGLYAEAGLGVLLFLYIAFALPESLPAARRWRSRRKAAAAAAVAKGAERRGGSEDGGMYGRAPLLDPVNASSSHYDASEAAGRRRVNGHDGVRYHNKNKDKDEEDEDEGETPTCGRRNNVFSALSYLFVGRALGDTKTPSSRSTEAWAAVKTEEKKKEEEEEEGKDAVLSPPGNTARRAQLAALFMLNFMLIVGFLRISFVYTELVFGWTSEFFDTFTALGRGVPLAIGAWLLALIWAHPPQRVQTRLIRVATVAIVLRMVLCALAPTGTLFFSVGALNMVGGALSPLLRAGLSATAAPSEQGLCLTGIAAIETVTGIWAPLAFGYVYAHTEPAHPTAVLWVFVGVAAAMVAIAASLRGGGGGNRKRLESP